MAAHGPASDGNADEFADLRSADGELAANTEKVMTVVLGDELVGFSQVQGTAFTPVCKLDGVLSGRSYRLVPNGLVPRFDLEGVAEDVVHRFGRRCSDLGDQPGPSPHLVNPDFKMLVDVPAAAIGVIWYSKLGRQEIGSDLGTQFIDFRRVPPAAPCPWLGPVGQLVEEGVVEGRRTARAMLEMVLPAHLDEIPVIALLGIMVLSDSLIGVSNVGSGVGDDPFDQGVVKGRTLVSGHREVAGNLTEVVHDRGV